MTLSPNPLVSIILTAFDGAPFVGQAVTSALNQTYENLELIVVDAGSTGEAEQVVATFDDERLAYVKADGGIGRPAARDRGLAEARGDLVGFLDADDYFLPRKVELQVDRLLRNPSVHMVYTASGCVGDVDRPITHVFRAPVEGRLYDHLAFLKPLTVPMSTVMLRREAVEAVGGFDDRMGQLADVDWLRRVSKTFEIGAIDQVACHVRGYEEAGIGALDPATLDEAIERYLDKVEREDGDVSPSVRRAGARRLYEACAAAPTIRDGAPALAAELLEKGRARFAPSVSIIMPVYNGANYMRGAIESALAQTYPDVEIVLVDDGSTDGGATEAIARSFGDRVRYFHQPNGGCSSALNHAVRQARGEYVSWLSHDDLLSPSKIERQVAFLAAQPDPALCIVYGDYSAFYGEQPVFSDAPAVAMPSVRPEDFRYFLTTHNILHGCTLLIPRRALLQHGLFDEGLQTVLDFDLWFKLGRTERYVYLPGVVVHSRAHPDQDTHRTADTHMREANELLARFAEKLSDEEIEAGSGQDAVGGCYVIADTLWRRNFKEAASSVLRLAERKAAAALSEGPSTAAGRAALRSLVSCARIAVSGGVVAPPAAGMRPTIQYETGPASGGEDRPAPVVAGPADDPPAVPAATDAQPPAPQPATGPAPGGEDHPVSVGAGRAADPQAVPTATEVDQMWAAYDSGRLQDVLRLAQDHLRGTAAADPGVRYVYALALKDVPGREVQALAQLDRALAEGFDPGWARFHRGTLRIRLGDESGQDDLAAAARLGGDAGGEARKALAGIAVKKLWAAYDAGRMQEVASLAEEQLREGAADPVIRYVHALALKDMPGREAEALAQFDRALADGFDPGWTRFHRGALKLRLGDESGRDDLAVAAGAGGDAGQEARKALAGMGI